ncbi:MAG: hypothetical protein BGO63_10460 [Candidatus Accumulibacter sp. 66-26]|nr:hypothetical protein [Accumulibacter sp.]OJW51545.1 MAG: hypothetical protein BGO63_10460 [Candidatus Accumulibacter sp. 66-26]
MGILALGNMLIAVVAAVWIFMAAKAVFRMPVVLNLPGASGMFFSAISLSGWITHDLFDGYMHMPAPDIPWFQWIIYFVISIAWYAAMAWLLTKWRRPTEPPADHTSS